MGKFSEYVRETLSLSEHLDLGNAESTIRKNINFKGPNVIILACAIVIASVGLNVNSVPVIIGAMLISPLMGPIFGIGMALATNDTKMLKEALMNFGIMVSIALIASAIYFRLTPLRFANPTELEARTNPSIYDVVIALFGGLAGIFEICRKDSSKTVLPGVAIATALMPPLCTAGYGLAHLNAHFFFGALYLFCINLVYIAMATYFMVKYLGFPDANFLDEKKAARTKRIISIIVLVFIIPSIYTAYNMIRFNNFERKVDSFVAANRDMDNIYIYDWHTESKDGGIVTIHVTGESLKAEDKNTLIASAEYYGIRENQLIIREHSLGSDDSDKSEVLLKGVYERTDAEINRKERQIRELETELNTLKAKEIPYVRITQEIKAQYPEIQELSISRGEVVTTDSLVANKQLIVIAGSTSPLGSQKLDKLGSWLKIRLEDSTVVVINQKANAK